MSECREWPTSQFLVPTAPLTIVLEGLLARLLAERSLTVLCSPGQCRVC